MTTSALSLFLAEAEKRRGSDDLAEGNVLLAVQVARRHAFDDADFEELLSVCLEALVRTARRWQRRSDHKVQFSTFVTHEMEKAIRRHRRQHVLLSAEAVKLLGRYRRATEEHYKTSGRWPRPEEVAEELGVSPERAREIAALEEGALSPASLDAPLGDAGGEEGATLADMVPGSPGADEAADLDRHALQQAADAARLTDYQRLALSLHYGVRLVDRATLRDVARASTWTAAQWARSRLKKRGAEVLEAIRG